MQIDIELYRTEVQVQEKPPVALSVIDIAPPHAQRTLLFVHGFAGQASQWAAQLSYFCDTHRVVAFDARGHGLSDKPESAYTMAELQRDLKALIDQLNLPPRFVLVGHSFGGAVAAEYAAAHPHRLEALVLIGTAGEYKLNDWLRRALNLPASWLKALEPIVRTRVSTPPFVIKNLFEHTLDAWKGWSLFGEIRTPTLVIMGHHDDLFPQADFDQVAARIPHALKIEIPVSAHMVMIERADAVNRAIDRFLDGRQDSPATWSYDHPPRARTSDRPWLRFYDRAVPHAVTIPDRPLSRFLERAARRFPLRTAVHDTSGGTYLLYWQLDRAANRMANALIRLGVQQGDRVLLMLPPGPPAVIAFYGILKAGALVVMLNPAETPDRLLRQVDLSGARILVTGDRHRAISTRLMEGHQIEWVVETAGDEYFAPLPRARYHLQGGDRRTKPPLGFLSWSEWVRKASPQRPPTTPHAQEGALIQFTSGTTGEPRAVLLTHNNLVASTIQVRHWFPGLQDGQEKFLSPLPMFHIYGILAGIHLPIALGATLLTLPSFDAVPVLNAIKHHRPTVFAGTPATFLALTEVRGLRTYDVAAVRLYVSGAAPLPVEVHEAFERLSKAQLLEGYGLSEAPAVAVDTLGGLRKLASVGLPLPNTDVRLVDLASQVDVSPGVMGELWVAGPQVMAGYWQDPDATTAALVQDAGQTWLRTGDLAVMDSDGYLRILGRVQDLWRAADASQTLVLPRHIEEVLYEHPGIKEAAALPIDGVWHAFVVLHRDERTNADEIIAYCQLRLPASMVPQAVVLREYLPKDALGKVQRPALLASAG